MRQTKALIVNVVIALLISGSALAETCADPLTDDSEFKLVVSCLKVLSKQNSDLKDRLSTLENKDAPQVPQGAVLSFNGPCPRGNEWSPYLPASGRFLMGAMEIGGQSGRGVGNQGGTMFNARRIDANISAGSYGYQDTMLKLDLHSPLNLVPIEDIPEIFREEARRDNNPKSYILPPFTVLQFCEKQ